MLTLPPDAMSPKAMDSTANCVTENMNIRSSKEDFVSINTWNTVINFKNNASAFKVTGKGTKLALEKYSKSIVGFLCLAVSSVYFLLNHQNMTWTTYVTTHQWKASLFIFVLILSPKITMPDIEDMSNSLHLCLRECSDWKCALHLVLKSSITGTNHKGSLQHHWEHSWRISPEHCQIWNPNK